MRTIPFDYEGGPQSGMGCVDWKDPPMEVFRQIDLRLADFQLEIVIHETNDDQYVWSIETRNAPISGS